MTTRASAPLKLKFAPGDYLCRMQVPGISAPAVGTLTLRASGRCLVELAGPMPIDQKVDPNGGWSAGFPQRRKYPVMRGTLLSAGQLGRGPDITLVEVDATYMGREGGNFSAQFAMIGRDRSAQEAAYRRAEIQITGLDAVAGVTPLKSIEFPVEKGRHLDGRWAAEGNPDSTLEWESNSTTMCFSYDCSATIGDAYNHTIAFSPTLTVELKEPVTPSEWFDLWIEPIRRIVTLSTGLLEQITYVSFSSANDERLDRQIRPVEVQVYAPTIAQSPYGSRTSDIAERRPAFTAAGGVSLLKTAQAWGALAAEHHPMLETFGGYLAEPEVHPRSRLLLLVQALEGLHGHAFRTEWEDRVISHRAARAEVLKTISPKLAENKDEWKFVKKFLAPKPISTLTVALEWALGAIPGDLSKELSQIQILKDICTNDRNVADATDAVRIIRNDLSHGNRGYPVSSIVDVVSVLERAASAHMMRLLGCSGDSQERAARGT